MQVSAVMSTPAVTVTPETTLQAAIGTMLEHQIGSVVVVDAAVTGILTRSDVLRAAYYEGGSLDSIPVSRGMSSDVVTTTPSTTLRPALDTMEANKIKKLPVMDDLELVGIVTMTDIAREMPSQVREAAERLDRRDDWTD